MVFGHQAAAVTILEGIRAKVGAGVKVTHASGPEIRREIPSMFDDFIPGPKKPPQPPAEAEAAFQQAVATAKDAEVVVMVLGEIATMSGEGASRASLDLPGPPARAARGGGGARQEGRARARQRAAPHHPLGRRARARDPRGLAAGHRGRQRRGRRPVRRRQPRAASCRSPSRARPRTRRSTTRASSRISPRARSAYRPRYWDGAETPLYPFGYGLSYTTFAYSNLKVAAPKVAVGQTATVTVDVKNSGAVAGDEVVQLYVHQRTGSDSRPRRELKGFERVALGPGRDEDGDLHARARRAALLEHGAEAVRPGGRALRRVGRRRLDGDHPRGARGDEVIGNRGGRSSSCSSEPWPLGAAAQTQTAPVKTDSGPVAGAIADGVAAYKGIPFAAPPVGDLRWRAPQPPKAWTALLAADQYAHDCMQNPFPSDAAPLGTPPAEDCLYLNVWTPGEARQGPLPVMVWIYGGGFVNGGSSPAVYDGSHFARRGIVFVSMNYRLGRFGFFAHPALTQENPKGPLGNYGFLDQIAALQWVKKNAAAFGGDPGQRHHLRRVRGRRVGEHADDLAAREGPLPQGDRRVGRRPRPRPHLHAAHPRHHPRRDRRRPRRWASAFAEKAGVKGEGPAVLLTALRALPAAAIVNGMNLMSPQPDTYSGPMVDGEIVPVGSRARVPRRPAGQGPLHDRRERPRVRLLPAAPRPHRRHVRGLRRRQGEGPARLRPRRQRRQGRDRRPAHERPGHGRAGAAAGPAGRATQPTWSYRFSYVASSLRANQKGACTRPRSRSCSRPCARSTKAPPRPRTKPWARP